MKYKVSASVEGSIFINNTYSCKKGEYTYEFVANKDNKLIEISISLNIAKNDIEKYKSEIEQINGIPNIVIGVDEKAEIKIRNEYRQLESNLSFLSMGGLVRIRWNELREEFIAENTEEEEMIKIKSFKMNKKYAERKVFLKDYILEHYVIDSDKYKCLTTAKAFWREGIIFFKQFQYIQAFCSYYFIIEDFYANRKTKEKEVIKEFNRSIEYKKVANKAYEIMTNDRKYCEVLNRLLEEEKCPYNGSGLQLMLFRMRGRLHHYFDKKTKSYGNPFNQNDFERIALICGLVAQIAISSREVAINNP